MMDFLDHLRAGLAALEIHNKRLLVAVSGGADSVALLCGLAELRSERQLHITAAHLDHRLRGETSTADALWVKALCERLVVPCQIGQHDVRTEQSRTPQTLEETARRIRYEFLESTAAQERCTEIAVAHTADDQAETVLHHILRGTGLSGLRGIPRERRLTPELRLIRPLLEVRRCDIENWLAQRGQDFRRDETNSDPAFTRNRIRHHLLPLLEENYNPQVIPALLRLGRQAGEMDDVLNHFAEAVLANVLRERSPHSCRLDCEPLSDHSLAFRRVCFIQLWRQQGWPRQRMTFAHWNQLAELVTKPRGAISLPHGLTARRRRDGLTVEWEPKSAYTFMKFEEGK